LRWGWRLIGRKIVLFGDHVPQLHVHIIGRYPGAPREFWGSKVDEWLEAPRGAETEIKKLSVNLRNFIRQNC
jgi:diadenosine tetraphosphate (Ap4A) HIT family hydrolase